MTKKKKIILAGVVLVLAAGGATLFFLALNFGRLAKSAIERFGPQVLGVPVTVSTVLLSPLSGRGALYGLKIGNPRGFTDVNVIELGKVSVKLELASLTRSPIRISEIEIGEPVIHWEGDFAQSNVGLIQGNVQRFVSKHAGEPRSSAPKKGGERKVLIHRLHIAGAKVGARLKGTGAAFSLPLPEITLTDIGKEKGGASIGEVTALLFERIGSGVAKALAASPEVLGGAVQSVGKGIGEGGSQVLKGVKSIFGK